MGDIRKLDLTVTIPWQVFLLVFSAEKGQFRDARIFWSKTPIEGPATPLLQYTMPNMNVGDGTGCWGGNWNPPVSGSPDEVARYVIEFMHTSAFNSDLHNGQVPALAPDAIRGIRLPDTIQDIPKDRLATTPVANYLLKMATWRDKALNPKADVCHLNWHQIGTVESLLAGYDL